MADAPEQEFSAEKDREAAAALAQMASALAAADGEDPAGEASADEAPAGEASADEDPADEDPAGEAPAGEASADEAPGDLDRDSAANSNPADSAAARSPARVMSRIVSRLRTAARLRFGGRPPRRRTAALALSVLLVTGLGGSTVATPRAAVGGFDTIAVGRPTAAPEGSPRASAPSATPSASARASAGRSATAATSPIAGQTGPSTALRKSPTATITFHGLMLDALVDSAATVGSAMAFTFSSDGPGEVSVQIVASAPLDTTTICLIGDGKPVGCDVGGSPGITQTTTTAHSDWLVNVTSPNAGTPTVDLAFSWPTERPRMTLNHGQFRGSPNPDSLRSLTATFRTRAAGSISVDAVWSPISLDATLTLTERAGTASAAIDQIQYSGLTGTTPAYAHTVRSGRNYMVSLYNLSRESGRPDLDVTIGFP